jgi:hypothetical protein
MATPSKPIALDRDALLRQRERTSIIREAMAGEVFSAENISNVLSESASKGQTAAYFEPREPMDLSETLTAKAAEDALNKAGFNTEWKLRQKPDGEPERYLRVSWGNDARPRDR